MAACLDCTTARARCRETGDTYVCTCGRSYRSRMLVYRADPDAPQDAPAPLDRAGHAALRLAPHDPELARVRALLADLRPDCADPWVPPQDAPAQTPTVRVRDQHADWGGIPRGLESPMGAMLARAEHSRDPLSLVVVDYLHLFERDAVDAKSREDQVIRRQVYALKTLAKALKVPVLMLVQFNRAGAKSERPTMFDAFGGSGIEQGADNVVILVPDASTKRDPVGRVTVYVDKRRGGATVEDGRVILFDRVRQRMRDLDDVAPRVDSYSGLADGGAWAPGGDAE